MSEKFKYKFKLSNGQIAYADGREALQYLLLVGITIVKQERTK